MQLLDLTLPTPEENLALDEALLDAAEAAGEPREVLRLWEPAAPMAVVGRSSRIDREIHPDACRQLGVPVLRRISGGAAVLGGPGCLMYALVLSCQRRPTLRRVDQAHRFVLGTMAKALARRVPGVCCQGISDLALEGQKFSGNSVRCKRDHLLYHGTLLYDYPLDLIGRCLAMPPHQPDYRDGREHGAFVRNLPLSAGTIRRALIDAWQARELLEAWPQQQTARLAVEKYASAAWNDE